jgi:hypothetical protein
VTDHSFREALLKQNGETSVEAQLQVFDDLVKADRRQARRLTIWTISVWAVWVTMIAVGLGLPMVLSASAPRAARPPQEAITPATTTVSVPVPAQNNANPGGLMPLVAAILGVVVMAVFFGLPIAGVVLLVMMIAARRSATMSQIQASLMSIDVQLRRALSQKTPSTGPQG